MELIDRIAKNIEAKRDDLSIDKLSKKADIPASTIIKVLRKEVKDVRVSTLEALAKAFNCKVDDLLK